MPENHLDAIFLKYQSKKTSFCTAYASGRGASYLALQARVSMPDILGDEGDRLSVDNRLPKRSRCNNDGGLLEAGKRGYNPSLGYNIGATNNSHSGNCAGMIRLPLRVNGRRK